ncbi:MAG TPA: hypothetical protein VM324_03790 [Egibacteraceae bacterium]|nr:hypothetical protein [Egibacteraceae bacterium]
MSDDRLGLLQARLAALETAPVDAHPEVLDAVHRALVAELGALAATRNAGTPQPLAGI